MSRVFHGLGAAGAVALTLLFGTAASGAAEIRLAQQDDPGEPAQDVPADAGDSSSMVVRVGRLEGQVRTLTGQIEQLQFQNKRLEDNLRKMQGDVDFRFQDLQRQGTPAAAAPARPAAPQKRSDADSPPAGDPVAPALPDAAPVPARPRVARAGDAFDPDADPNAPGAPRPLGTTAPSVPLSSRAARGGNAPLDLMQRPPAAADDAALAPAVIPAPPAAGRDPGAVASLVPGGTREEYDADFGLFRQGQYDGAATGFQAFANKYPRDRLVPDALFMAGESYARLGRQREAAEQFLKVSTDFSKSPRAPEALLRLGTALAGLGAKDQACATYAEVTRRYPAASADVRSGVDRELKRARCPGNG